MSDPLVSVIMPIYNGGKYLRYSIESILNQTYRNFEFLILNDGSNDNSLTEVEFFHDARIRIFNSSNNFGLVFQLNKGIKLARGKYIARMDQDDVALPSRLHQQVTFMEDNSHVGLCGMFVKTFNDSKRFQTSILPTEHDAICALLLFSNAFFHPVIMFRKDVLLTNQLFYQTDTDGAEDYDLYIRLLKRTKLANIPQVGLYYRLHESNMTKTHSVRQKNLGDRIRADYLNYFLNGENIDSKLKIEKHLIFCSSKINCHSDLIDLLDWVNYLLKVNETKQFYKENDFKVGIAHFLYRKLVGSKYTNLFSLNFFAIQNWGLFNFLPLNYKFFFFLRCVGVQRFPNFITKS